MSDPSPPTPIGGYEDWPAFAASAPGLSPADARAQAVADVLGVLRPGIRSPAHASAHASAAASSPPRPSRQSSPQPSRQTSPQPSVETLHCATDAVPGLQDPHFLRSHRAAGPDGAAVSPENEARSRLAAEELSRHEHDGLTFAHLRWNVGYGPDTHAWLVRPTDATGPLPGVLALHAHGGRRWQGADTLVDPGPGVGAVARGRSGGAASVDAASVDALRADAAYSRARRREGYSSRAIANELAHVGFVVLAHDTFSWGSRRFDLARPPAKPAAAIEAAAAVRERRGLPVLGEADAFDAASALHEDLLAKTAGVLGTSFAGAVVTDDLAALDVLAGLGGVDAGRLAAVGFSGGGARAHYLGALDARVRAEVVVCMMSTFEALVPHYLENHTWMFHSPGLARLTEWPTLGAISPDRSLPHRRILALYGERDRLFPLEGMRAAHRMLVETVPAAAGGGPGYEGRFHRTGHAFTAAMQREAAAFLRATFD